MDTNKIDIVQFALEAYKGYNPQNYSTTDTMDTLRNALVAANGGSTKLNFTDIQNGECKALFKIVVEIVNKIITEGLTGNEFFMSMVDYRNVKLGDSNVFYTPDDSLFVVADIARGINGARRQRLTGGSSTTIKTQLKVIEIYEELDRVLSGRVDFNEFISRVAASFQKKMLDDIFAAWTSIAKTAGSKYFPTAGTYSEAALIEMIDHVESATGKEVTLLGTRKALRKLTTAVQSDKSKEDYYNTGYYGKFNGTPIVRLPQVHARGTDTNLLSDNEIYVVPTGIKPIKFVTEGTGYMFMGDPLKNSDFTQEYMYATQYNVGIMINEKFGIYTMS